MVQTIKLDKDTVVSIVALGTRLPGRPNAAGAFQSSLYLVTALMSDEAGGDVLCTFANGKPASAVDFTLARAFLAANLTGKPNSQSAEKVSASISDEDMADLTRIHKFMVEKKILGKNSKPEDTVSIVIDFTRDLLDKMKNQGRELGVVSRLDGVKSRRVSGFNW